MPRLTSAQLTTLKNHLAANTNTVVVGGTTFAINSNDVLPSDHTPPSNEAADRVRDWYNLVASPAYSAWNPAASKEAVFAAMVVSNFTPADSIPAASGNTQGTNDALLYQNRALLCQLKQANAFALVNGSTPIDARSSGARTNFQDCLKAIPSGAGGGNTNAGWGTAAAPGAVNLAMQHSARNGEKLLAVVATGAGNDGVSARGDIKNPDAPDSDALGAAIVLLTAQDIKDAWTS